MTQWRNDRRYINPSFNASMTQNFLPIFCSISDKMVAEISANHCDGKEFDVNHYTERCLLRTILATSFDIFDEDLDENDIEFFVEGVKK